MVTLLVFPAEPSNVDQASTVETTDSILTSTYGGNRRMEARESSCRRHSPKRTTTMTASHLVQSTRVRIPPQHMPP